MIANCSHRTIMNQKINSEIALLTPSDDYYCRYVKIPYRMLTDTLTHRTEELTVLEAFIQVLASVRHEDLLEGSGENQRLCRRGESYQSQNAWSELFHWDRFKTRRYLVKLKQSGLIELENMGHTTRLRVIHYDYYVGRQSSPETKPHPDDFEKFWDAYHETTQIQATDKDPSHRCWRKLSFEERTKAVERIPRYYYSLSKTTYCVKALTYLKNKKFNDQFLY